MLGTDIAGYADLIAAAGVIGSLIILAYQIHQNTRAMKVQNWLSIVERIAEHSARALDAGVADTVHKGLQSYARLSEKDKLVFSAWAYEFIICVNRHIGFEDKGIRPEIAAMTERYLKWFFAHEGAVEWWTDAGRKPFPSHYETVIDANLP